MIGQIVNELKKKKLKIAYFSTIILLQHHKQTLQPKNLKKSQWPLSWIVILCASFVSRPTACIEALPIISGFTDIEVKQKRQSGPPANGDRTDHTGRWDLGEVDSGSEKEEEEENSDTRRRKRVYKGRVGGGDIGLEAGDYQEEGSDSEGEEGRGCDTVRIGRGDSMGGGVDTGRGGGESHIGGGHTDGGHTDGGHIGGGHTRGGHTNGGHIGGGHTRGGHTEGGHTEGGHTGGEHAEVGHTDGHGWDGYGGGGHTGGGHTEVGHTDGHEGGDYGGGDCGGEDFGGD